MLTPAPDYDSLVAAFRWRIPERYNIGVDVCDRWAAVEPERAAILEIGPDGRVATLTYGALRERSNRLANALRARGIGRGDRVAILLPQGAAVPIAHIAVYKLGAVALPLAALFGIDALAYRLADAGAKALVTNAAGLGKLQEIRPDLPALECVISTDGPDGAAEGFSRVLEAASPDFTPVDTAADDPAMMIYTSGTTGPAKGALHAHRVLLGHLPGVEMPHEFLPQPGDRLWTPADWAWAGGLLNVLLPGLHHGVPVVARKTEKFDPEEAFRLMADHERAQHLRAADGAQDAAHRAEPARALRAGAAHDRVRRRDARRRDLRLGPGGARPDDQRVLRPDRVQPGALLLCRDRGREAGRDRQAGAGAQGGGDPRRRQPRASPASSGRSRSRGRTR